MKKSAKSIRHIKKSVLEKNESTRDMDVPRFRIFDGRKYRAVMHDMTNKEAIDQAKKARSRGYFARVVVYRSGLYALYVAHTKSLTEEYGRNHSAEMRRGK